MSYYVGLDISDATTNFCIKDKSSTIIHEGIAKTHPDDIISSLKNLSIPIGKIGMETGAKSNWLYLALSVHYNVVCYNSAKVAQIISARGNKTDKNDAQVIAEITRLDCLSDVLNLATYVKTPESQEVLTFIRSREATVQRQIDIYNQIRAIFKTHGHPLPHITQETFTKTVLEAKKELPELVALAIEEIIAAYAPLCQSIARMTKKIEELSWKNHNAQILRSIPEVGPITALYFAAYIDDPKRFAQSRSVGSYFGLTPLEYSSGQKQHQGSISKRGDSLMRKLLVGVARRILQRNAKTNSLKKWGQKKEKKLGKNRGAVALARHLAVIMMAMLMTGKAYKEPTVSPPEKKVVITTEELTQLAKLSQEKGSIELKSIKNLLKKLTQAAETVKI